MKKEKYDIIEKNLKIINNLNNKTEDIVTVPLIEQNYLYIIFTDKNNPDKKVQLVFPLDSNQLIQFHEKGEDSNQEIQEIKTTSIRTSRKSKPRNRRAQSRKNKRNK